MFKKVINSEALTLNKYINLNNTILIICKHIPVLLQGFTWMTRMF